jgi:molybdopterin molybdotransferase
MISFKDAHQRTLQNISPLEAEEVDVVQAVGRILAEDLFALVDSPTLHVSLKDGYAIQSRDISSASPSHPISLKLLGVISAGNHWEGEVTQGTALRILSGAPIPLGAQAVLSEEFASDDGQTVTAINHSEPGRNILQKASDIQKGQLLEASGTQLSPTQVGFIAAAGHHHVKVYQRPKVAIIATGDEVIAPGKMLSEGKIYASNLVTLGAWCDLFGMKTSTSIVMDQSESLRAEILQQIASHDAILTSGGAWKGDRDLIVGVLDKLGWQKIYHRVRIGPGKAIAFGIYQEKPVFCLPGGPPSNHMAFLQLALPGLQRLGGLQEPGLPKVTAQLAKTVSGMKSWTQFIHGELEVSEKGTTFQPVKPKSRLQMMAQTSGVMMIPEGIETISKGTMVLVQKII